MCINKINIFNYPVLFMYTIFIIQTFNHWKDQIGGFEGVKLGMGFVWRTISSTKARVPQSSWADVDVELWLLYVSAPDSPFLTEWDKNEHRDFSSDMSKKGIRTYWGYDKGRCTYGNNCRFIHKCSECYGNHPLSACSKS